MIAFSSEGDAGSREENAHNKNPEQSHVSAKPELLGSRPFRQICYEEWLPEQVLGRLASIPRYLILHDNTMRSN
jgi:hypothetical protein